MNSNKIILIYKFICKILWLFCLFINFVFKDFVTWRSPINYNYKIEKFIT